MGGRLLLCAVRPAGEQVGRHQGRVCRPPGEQDSRSSSLLLAQRASNVFLCRTKLIHPVFRPRVWNCPLVFCGSPLEIGWGLCCSINSKSLECCEYFAVSDVRGYPRRRLARCTFSYEIRKVFALWRSVRHAAAASAAAALVGWYASAWDRRLCRYETGIRALVLCNRIQ